MKQIIRDGITQAIPEWYKAFSPILEYLLREYILKVLFVVIIVASILRIVEKFSIMSGESRTEARKKVSKMKNLFDLFYSLSDIFPKKK